MAGKPKRTDYIKYFFKRSFSSWRNFYSYNKFAFWLIFSEIFIILLIILMPYLLKFKFVKSVVSYYLNSFPSLEYKIAFIALLGSLLGTIISISGALAIQNITSKSTEKKLDFIKKQKGLTLFHRLIAPELFSNFNILNEKLKFDKTIILSLEDLNELNIKLKTDKFNDLFDKLIDLHCDLTITISEIYIFFERIKNSTCPITITEDEYSNFIQSYNVFQRKYNH